MLAIDNLNAFVFNIPLQSPDLNPIENFFHTLTVRLKNDALQKNDTKETFKELSSRVKETILSCSSEEIDKIIVSRDKRITAVLKGKGQRTKYIVN